MDDVPDERVWGHGNYRRFPRIAIEGFQDQAWVGYEPLAKRLKSMEHSRDRLVVTAECYPGSRVETILEGLSRYGFSKVFNVEECVKQSGVLAEQLRDQLTDDRVFGHMKPDQELEEFFDVAKLAALRREIAGLGPGSILVYGTGAALAAECLYEYRAGDVLLYFDLTRREIENRYAAGTGNFHGDNGNDSYLEKFKRGYFAEWRMADRWKKELIPRIDYVISGVNEECPSMCSGAAFREGIRQAAARPFRMVPYFAPEVWGGQWMEEAFGLERSCEKYAWGFDGVPEENSIILDFGSADVELPAMDMVLMEPEALLGEDVYSRFGAEFPIRFDLLDTIDGQNLSLQVHPTREYIKKEFGLAYTQDESYYILDTHGEESCVYLGIKPGVSREEMEFALREAQDKGGFDAERYVNCFPVKKHDHVLIPAGTVHCSGAGTMVLEISATPYIFTFKMWDWGRLGLDGRPRPIHIDRALDNIRWERNEDWSRANLLHRDVTVAQEPGYLEERTGLHELEFIETRRISISGRCVQSTCGTVQVLNLVEGEEALVESPQGEFPPLEVHYAETFIIPAQAGEFSIRPYGASAGGSIIVIKANVRPAAEA